MWLVGSFHKERKKKLQVVGLIHSEKRNQNKKAKKYSTILPNLTYVSANSFNYYHRMSKMSGILVLLLNSIQNNKNQVSGNFIVIAKYVWQN